MNPSKPKTSRLLIVLSVILLITCGYLGWTKYQAFSTANRFKKAQQSIKLPTDLHSDGQSSFTTHSDAMLPHYAPMTHYGYSYDPTRHQEVRDGVAKALLSAGYSLWKNEDLADDFAPAYTAAQKGVDGNWHVYGQNFVNHTEVQFDAHRNGVVETICNINNCY